MIQNDNSNKFTHITSLILITILIFYIGNYYVKKEEKQESEKQKIEKFNYNKNELKSEIYNENIENSEKFIKLEDSYVGGFLFKNIKVDNFNKGNLNDGYYLLRIRNGKTYYNLMNQNGVVIFKNWSSDKIDDFSSGYAKVTKEDQNYNRKYNFINKDGNFLFEKDLEYYNVDKFSEGYAFISDNKTRSCNLINPKGELQLKNWIDGCFGAVQYFKDGKEELYIQKDGKRYYNFLLKDEMKKFFYQDSIYQIDGNRDTVYDFSKGYLRVMKYDNGRLYNMMARDGKLLYDWTKEKPEY